MNKDLAGIFKRRFTAALRFACTSAVALATFSAMADPILPYAAPIAAQLESDIAALEAIPERTAAENQQLRASRAALEEYQRSSANLPGDVAILRKLNSTLPGGYGSLLESTLTGYAGDFEGRRVELGSQLASTPASAPRKLADRQLQSIANVLARIENASSTTRVLDHLDTAARRLVTASNTVRRATLARVAASSMTAKISRINFNATRRSTIGNLTNGVLNIAGFHVADFGRGIQLYVEGVTTDTPSTYPLAGNNFATYTAMAPNNRVFIFQSVPGPEENPSSVTIEAITQRFVIGRFNFTAEIQGPVSEGDTNRVTTITNGLFQLNFF